MKDKNFIDSYVKLKQAIDKAAVQFIQEQKVPIKIESSAQIEVLSIGFFRKKEPRITVDTKVKIMLDNEG